MVGGTVCQVRDEGEKVYIRVRAVPYGNPEYCAIHVERTAEALSVTLGDTLWWQGSNALWTPESRTRIDVRIPRLGWSGDF